MIESQKRLEEVMSHLHPLEAVEVVELIKALREVARAAVCFVASGYEKPQPDWRQPTIDALAVIEEKAPWLLEKKK